MTRRGGAQFIPRPSSWRPGDDPVWAGLSAAERRFSLDEIETVVRAHDAVNSSEIALVSDARAAAVLVVGFEHDGDTRVILTKRPDTMPSHRGEIAFPGGKHDPVIDASLEAAALREANEEVGLDPSAVQIVGRLDSLGTVASRFVIHPVVGRLAIRPDVRAHPVEVVSVFDVGIAELMHEDVYRQERWDMYEQDVAMHFFDLDGETVWGATGRVLYGLLELLTQLRTGPVAPRGRTR